MESPEPASPVESDAAATAAEAERLASSDPDGAVELARWVLGSTDDPALITVAHRALGVAARTRRDGATMTAEFETAVELAESNGLAAEAAFSKVLLASARYIDGDPNAAKSLLQAALPDLDGERLTLATIQLGIITGMAGEYGEGLRILDTVAGRVGSLPRARQAVFHTNRGSNLLGLGRASEAISAYEMAVDLCLEADELHLAMEALFNEARARANSGDVVGALGCFERLDRMATGPSSGLDLSDRAVVLLSAGLLSEAEEAASRARATDETIGAAWRPIAAMIHAQTLEAQGRFEECVAPAREARRYFEEQLRVDMSKLAAAIETRATLRSGETVAPDTIVTLAGDLAKWGAKVDAMHLLVAAATTAPTDRERFAEQALEIDGDGIDVEVLRSEAAARLARERGDAAGLERATERGLDVIGDWRQTIGSSELQASTLRRADGLIHLYLADALESGEPDKVLHRLEVVRRASTLSNRTNRRDDQLESLLAEYRNLGGHLERGNWHDRRSELERRIRERARAIESSSARPVMDVGAVFERVAEQTIVVFGEVQGELFSVTRVPGADPVLRRGLPTDDIVREIGSVELSVTRLASPLLSDSGERAFSTVLDAAGGRLAELLFEGIGDGPVLVVPSPSLRSLAWGAVATLADRPFALAPSITSWASRHEGVNDGRVVFVGAEDPPSAADEARLLAAIHDTVPLTDSDATVHNALDAMQRARLTHLAAHGTFRSDNPLLSAIHLNDGPITVYDIERIDDPPDVLVLSACEVARTGHVVGDALLGMTASLMAAGTSSVVASTAVVSDAAVPAFMETWHRRFAGGASPSEALAAARHEHRDTPGGRAAGASFVAIGS